MEGHRIHTHDTSAEQLEQERTGGRVTRLAAAARMQEGASAAIASDQDDQEENECQTSETDREDAIAAEHGSDGEQGQAFDDPNRHTHHLQFLGEGAQYQRLKQICLEKQAGQLEVSDGIDSVLAFSSALEGQKAYISAVGEFTEQLRKDRNYPFANKGQVNKCAYMSRQPCNTDVLVTENETKACTIMIRSCKDVYMGSG